MGVHCHESSVNSEELSDSFEELQLFLEFHLNKNCKSHIRVVTECESRDPES